LQPWVRAFIEAHNLKWEPQGIQIFDINPDWYSD